MGEPGAEFDQERVAQWLKQGKRVVWQVRQPMTPSREFHPIQPGFAIVFNLKKPADEYKLSQCGSRFMTHAEYSKDRWKGTL